MPEQTLKDKTAKGLLWGGLSNAIQQALNLVFGIFLARLLTPGDYGMIGMITVFAFIANNIQEAGFTQAIANKKNISSKDYNAVFWMSVLTSLCLYTVLFFCAPLIAAFYKTPALTPLARYLFLSFVFGSLGIAHYAYIFKNLMVKQRAIANIAALVASGVIGVAMAWRGYAYWGIATQTLVYTSVNTLCYWHYSRWRPTLHFDFSPLRGMIGFSSKLMVNNIVYHINNNVLNIVLGRYYNKNDVGYFTQANKWNIMGHSMVSGMISGVAQPVLSAIAPDDGERRLRAFRKMLRFTAFVSFPVMFGLALIAPEFIAIAITDKWLPSAKMMQIICLAGAFLPVNTLYSNLIVSRGRSSIVMWSNIVMGIVYIAAVVLLRNYGIYAMICAYAAIQILWLAFWQTIGRREIGISNIDAAKDISPFMLLALLSMGIAYYAALPIENIYLSLLCKIVVAAAVYVLSTWLCGSATLRECVHYILKK